MRLVTLADGVVKSPTTISINATLKRRAIERGINLSALLELALVDELKRCEDETAKR